MHPPPCSPPPGLQPTPATGAAGPPAVAGCALAGVRGHRGGPPAQARPRSAPSRPSAVGPPLGASGPPTARPSSAPPALCPS
eukprot:8153794-Alexandrium_andersonii.AAC.1